jgi:hypothetical protein
MIHLMQSDAYLFAKELEEQGWCDLWVHDTNMTRHAASQLQYHKMSFTRSAKEASQHGKHIKSVNQISVLLTHGSRTIQL